MIEVQIDWIEPTDFLGWDEFEEFSAYDPLDHFQWFTICVSEAKKDRGTNFDVLVSTPKAIGRAKKKNEKFKGLVIDSFSPTEAKNAIEQKVNKGRYYSYHDIVESLKVDMYWEYGN